MVCVDDHLHVFSRCTSKERAGAAQISPADSIGYGCRSIAGSNAKKFSGLLPSSLAGRIVLGAANSHRRCVTAMVLESKATDPESHPNADLDDCVDALVCVWHSALGACYVLSTKR